MRLFGQFIQGNQNEERKSLSQMNHKKKIQVERIIKLSLKRKNEF